MVNNNEADIEATIDGLLKKVDKFSFYNVLMTIEILYPTIFEIFEDDHIGSHN